VIENEEFGFKLRLTERSWYGDFEVLLDQNSTFNLQAGVNKDSENPLVKIMSIDSTRFRRYADEYPSFRRFILLRSSVRRAYINFKMKLSSYESFFKAQSLEFEPEFIL